MTQIKHAINEEYKSEVFLMDCMEGMKQYPDKYFDLAVVDPPYGIGESLKKRCNFNVKQKNGAFIKVNENSYTKKTWDKNSPSKDYFFSLISSTKNQIIFGANYYELEMLGFENTKTPRRNEYEQFIKNRPYGFIIWDKMNGNNDFNDCEIIYTSMPIKSHIIYYMWNGMMQGKCVSTSQKEASVQIGNKKMNEVRIHPTQKPILLYNWIFKRYAQPGFKVLDTHLGSQSSRISANKNKLHFTGFELDPDYFRDGNKRYEDHVSQLTLF